MPSWGGSYKGRDMLLEEFIEQARRGETFSISKGGDTIALFRVPAGATVQEVGQGRFMVTVSDGTAIEIDVGFDPGAAAC